MYIMQILIHIQLILPPPTLHSILQAIMAMTAATPPARTTPAASLPAPAGLLEVVGATEAVAVGAADVAVAVAVVVSPRRTDIGAI